MYMSPAKVSSGLHNSFPTSTPFLGSYWAVFSIFIRSPVGRYLGCSSFSSANDVLKIPVCDFVWRSWVNKHTEVECLAHIMGIYFTFIFKKLLLFLKFIFDCSGSCPWAFSCCSWWGLAVYSSLWCAAFWLRRLLLLWRTGFRAWAW